MIPCLQKRGNIETHDATHDHSQGHDGRGQRDRKAGVGNQGINDNTDRFAARDDDEGIESYDEEERDCAWEASGEDGENGPEKTG